MVLRALPAVVLHCRNASQAGPFQLLHQAASFSTSPSVDPKEAAKFAALAARWWDTQSGPFAALHAMNPVRVKFIEDTMRAHLEQEQQAPGAAQAAVPQAAQGSVAGSRGAAGAPLALAAQRRMLQDLEVLDVGCGGGLLSEALGRAGAKVALGHQSRIIALHLPSGRPIRYLASGYISIGFCCRTSSLATQVTGIDITEENIGAAQQHLQQQGTQLAQRVQYHLCSAEDLVAQGRSFPVVVASEVIEHVTSPAEFLQVLAQLAQPGGAVIVSTLSRTAQAYALAIIGAEYVTGLVPRGTHDWSKFITPQELALMGREAGLCMDHLSGIWYNPLTRAWAFTPDCSVNYIAKFSRLVAADRGQGAT